MRQRPVTTARYAVLQSSYWLTLCAIVPFSSVFLLGYGFTSAQVGLIMAWANLLAMFVQPMVGAFADRSRKVFLGQIMAAFASLGVLLAAGMLLLPLPKLLLGGMFLLAVAAVMINQPLVNAICIYYTDRGVDINFGVARGIGSGVYALTSWLLGVLVSRFGTDALLISSIVLCLVLIALALSYHPIQEPQQSNGGAEQPEMAAIGIRGFVKKYPKFLLLLAGCMLLFVFHTYSTMYFYQIVLNIGGDSADMGFSNALAALVELPAMFLFGRMVRCWSCERLLQVASVAFIVKAVAFFLAPSMPWMNVAQCFQAVSYAVYVPATIYFANRMMDGCDQNKGQTLLTAANAAAAIVGGLTGGVIVDCFGVSAMLIVGICCTVLGTFTIFFSAGKGSGAPAKDPV